MKPTKSFFFVSMFLLLAVASCGKPPQLHGNEKSYKATDALFTAIGRQNSESLEDCQQRLSTLKESGDIDDAAYDYLQGIIEQARAGKWEAAQTKLRKFIKAQRRT